jgi:glycosyltransferase involved in cell wall biosynthesis
MRYAPPTRSLCVGSEISGIRRTPEVLSLKQNCSPVTAAALQEAPLSAKSTFLCQEPAMRILLLAPAIADYCVEYANALANRAHVTLVAPHRTFKDDAKFVDSAVDLRLMDWPRHRSLKNLNFMYRLRRQIDLLRPDVVHILSEGVLWLNLVLPTAQKYGLVTTVHDVTYHPGDRASRRVPRWFADQLIRRSDRIIVHGSILRTAAESRYPEIRDRLSILPHIVLKKYRDISVIRNMKRCSSGTTNVLFFGRIYPYKGLHVLIKSIALVTKKFPDIRVVIAGGGDNFSNYKRQMVDQKFFEIRNRYIPDEEAAQLFIDADIVVLPYVEASQSGVLAIANAFGKAVIVTDVGELGRVVVDGVSGLVVPPADERSLADAILKLATDASIRARLGNAGQALADQTASPEAVAEGAIAIYTSVADARRAGRGGDNTVKKRRPFVARLTTQA